MRKQTTLYVLTVLCLIGLTVAFGRAREAQPEEPSKPPETEPTFQLTTDTDRVSYVLGLSSGRRLRETKLEINAEAYARGFRDGFAGSEPMLDEQERLQAMQTFHRRRLARQAEEVESREKEATENRKEAERFLAQNKKREGVKTLANGLQYEILREGDGPRPGPKDTVTVNYRGTLPDGTVFDSSYQRGEPATFPVDGVIPGWTEALQMMRKGAKWKLYIPPDLAYGERGARDTIGPNQLLVFEVELLDIK